MSRFFLFSLLFIFGTRDTHAQQKFLSQGENKFIYQVSSKEKLWSFMKNDPMLVLVLNISDSTKCKVLYKIMENRPKDSVSRILNAHLMSLCNKNIKGIDKVFYLKYFSRALQEQGDLDSTDFNKSYTYYNKSLLLKQYLNDTSGIFRVVGSLLDVTKYLGLNDLRFQYCKTGLRLAENYQYPKLIADYLLSISDMHKQFGQMDSAFIYAFKSLNVSEKHNNYKGQLYALYYLAYFNALSGNMDKSLEFGNESLKKSQEHFHVEIQAYSLNLLYGVYKAKGDNIKSLYFLRKASNLFDSINDKNGLVICMRNLAGDLYDIQKKPKEAMKILEQVLVINKELKNYQGIADALNVLSIINSDVGETKKAIMQVKQAIDLGEKHDEYIQLVKSYDILGGIYSKEGDVKNTTLYFYKGLAIAEKAKLYESVFAYNISIGYLNLKHGQLDKASYFFYKNLSLLDSISNVDLKHKCYYYLGALKEEQGLFDEAIKLQNKSLEFASNNMNTFSNLALARLYKSKGNADSSLNNYKIALKCAELGGLKTEMSECFIGFTEYYLCANNYTNALPYAKKSLILTKELNDNDRSLIALLNLKRIYTKLGDSKKALLLYEQYVELKDSIYNNKNQKEIIKKQLDFEFEKKVTEQKNKLQKKEIIFQSDLKRQKTITYFIIGFACLALIFTGIFLYQRNKQKQLAVQLKSKNETLKQLNDSKTKLFSIIGHDIKSPMASILSYTELLSENEMEFTSQEIKTFAVDMTHSVRNLNGMLDSLLLWSLNESNQLKPQFTNVNISGVLSSTIELLEASAKRKNITIKTSLIQNDEVLTDKNMLSVVFRNILSNAIKFSKNESSVLVDLVEFEEKYSVIFKDSGVGMSEERLSLLIKTHQLNSTNGTFNEKGNGLGLLLCYEFMKKLNGFIVVESELEKGTQITIDLPKSVFFMTM